MNLPKLLNDFSPTLTGAAGTTMLSITPGDISNAGQLFIVLATVITQLISIFKKKKPTTDAQESK